MVGSGGSFTIFLLVLSLGDAISSSPSSWVDCWAFKGIENHTRVRTKIHCIFFILFICFGKDT
jgi:hypothetical protein